jgi:hypothetical protein
MEEKWFHGELDLAGVWREESTSEDEDRSRRGRKKWRAGACGKLGQNSHYGSEKSTLGWVRGQTCLMSKDTGPKLFEKN